MNKNKAKYVKQSLALSLSDIFNQVISFPVSIVIASTLGPWLLGVLKIINLIRKYIGYASLGMQKAMFRQVSLAYGREHKVAAEETKKIVLSWEFLSLFIALGALWVIFACGIHFKGSIDFSILTILSLLLPISAINSYINSLLKCEGLFVEIAKRNIITTLTYVFTIIPMLFFLKIKGILLSEIFSCIAGICYGLKFIKLPKVQFYLPLKNTIAHLKISILLFFNSFAEEIFWTIDMIVIGIMLPLYQLGLYAFVLGAAEAVNLVMGGFNNVVVRHMFVRGGQQEKNSSSHTFQNYMKSPYAGYMMIAQCIAGATLFLFDFIIKAYLPKFNDSRACLIIIVLGIMIYEARVFANYYLNASHRLKLLFVLLLSGITLNFTLDVLFIKSGYSILGAAWASTISCALYIIAVVFISFRYIFNNFKTAFLFLAKIFFITTVLFLLLYNLRSIGSFHYALEETFAYKTIWGIFEVGIKTLTYSIITVFLYCCIFRKENMWGELREVLLYIIPLKRERPLQNA